MFIFICQFLTPLWPGCHILDKDFVRLAFCLRQTVWGGRFGLAHAFAVVGPWSLGSVVPGLVSGNREHSVTHFTADRRRAGEGRV